MITNPGTRGSSPSAPPIALFGGSFDPPHHGHRILLQDVVEVLGLHKVLIIPVAHSPLKKDSPQASGEARMAMLQAAYGGDERFAVVDWELRRPPPSYSLDTVNEARRQFPNHPLYWILGEDQFTQLPRWHAIEQLAEMVTFLCLTRSPSTSPKPPRELPQLRWKTITRRQIDLSSTEIRERIRHGKSVDFLLPPEVISYIQNYDLYSGNPSS